MQQLSFTMKPEKLSKITKRSQKVKYNRKPPVKLRTAEKASTITTRTISEALTTNVTSIATGQTSTLEAEKSETSEKTSQAVTQTVTKLEPKHDPIIQVKSETISPKIPRRERPNQLKLEPPDLSTVKPELTPLTIDVTCSHNSNRASEKRNTRQTSQKTNPQEVTIHRGSCFCGAVQFEFTSRPKVRALVNCTCDSCQKYLDACLYIRSDNFKITAGEDKVTCFRVGVGIVSNNFCSVCGVKVFRKVSNAPLKIANLLVAICGPHPPLEDTAELPSPTPEENTCAFKSGPEKCDVIGIGNIDAIQDKSISYEKILTVDMTKISWDEMKRLLSV